MVQRHFAPTRWLQNTPVLPVSTINDAGDYISGMLGSGKIITIRYSRDNVSVGYKKDNISHCLLSEDDFTYNGNYGFCRDNIRKLTAEKSEICNMPSPEETCSGPEFPFLSTGYHRVVYSRDTSQAYELLLSKKFPGVNLLPAIFEEYSDTSSNKSESEDKYDRFPVYVFLDSCDSNDLMKNMPELLTNTSCSDLYSSDGACECSSQHDC